MKRIALSVAAVLLAGGAAFGEQVDNPEFASWAGAPVGTAIRITLTTAASDGGAATSATVTEKLVDKTPEQVLVEVAVVPATKGRALAMQPEQKIISAKTDAEDAAFPPAGATVIGTGRETLKVDGGDIETTRTEYVYEMPSIRLKIHATTWMSATTPGLIVKQESYPVDHPRDVSTTVLERVTRPAAATQAGGSGEAATAPATGP